MTDFSNTTITELAALIAEHLYSHGIEVVLVGGLAVEIYTENLYLTKDIDMVNVSEGYRFFMPLSYVHGIRFSLSIQCPLPSGVPSLPNGPSNFSPLIRMTPSP